MVYIFRLFRWFLIPIFLIWFIVDMYAAWYFKVMLILFVLNSVLVDLRFKKLSDSIRYRFGKW